jgi:predicted metal-dependent phosphoesterase TrpH
MLFDMHIHTSYSACSVIDLSELLRRSREVGLDGICITDHDTISSKSEFIDSLELCVIVGMEYTTSEGDFLVFGPVDYIPGQMDAKYLLKWIKKEGGVAIAAHPFRKYRSVDPRFLQFATIVESVNGRNLPHENELCKSWLQQFGCGVKEVGGSDAHTVGEIGQVVTSFQNNIYDADDLIHELQCGNYSPLRRIGREVINRQLIQGYQ